MTGEPGVSDGVAAVLAIDGGNSKTDVALIGWDGTVLAALRGPGASHETYGIDGAMIRLGDMIAEVAGEQVGQPVDPVDPYLPFPGEVVEPDVAQ